MKNKLIYEKLSYEMKSYLHNICLLWDYFYNNKDKHKELFMDESELLTMSAFFAGFNSMKFELYFLSSNPNVAGHLDNNDFFKCLDINPDDIIVKPIEETIAFNIIPFDKIINDSILYLKNKLDITGDIILSDFEACFLLDYLFYNYHCENICKLLKDNFNIDIHSKEFVDNYELVMSFDRDRFKQNIQEKTMEFSYLTITFKGDLVTLDIHDDIDEKIRKKYLAEVPSHCEIISIDSENPTKSSINNKCYEAIMNPNMESYFVFREFNSKIEKAMNLKTKVFFSNDPYLNIDDIAPVCGLKKVKNDWPTPMLDKYGKDLTSLEYLKDPAVGRDQEIKRLEQILLYPEKDKSIIITGESGCGKTALVRGLAYRLQNGDVPNSLKDLRIISIDITTLVAGTKYVGTLEEKMKDILEEASSSKNIILFIDEIHQALSGGKGEKNDNSVSEILKPYLDYGDVRIIGATTTDEYEEYIENDQAFKTRFKKVEIKEPSDGVVYQILDDLINKYDEISYSKLDATPEEQDMIIKWLIESTNEKNRSYNDRSSNPRLVLDILKEAYAIAAINDRKKISYDDLAEALRCEDRLYTSSKEMQIEKLKSLKPSKLCKIIQFTPKK